jgi:hypothetical protein
VEAIFWIFSINPVNIFSPELCKLQKKWLLSLKRQSTLISQSNEILQNDFFDSQRAFLNNNLTLNASE